MYTVWIAQLNRDPNCGIPAPKKPEKKISQVSEEKSKYVINKFIKIFEWREKDFCRSWFVQLIMLNKDLEQEMTNAMYKVKISHLHIARMVECYQRREILNRLLIYQYWPQFKAATKEETKDDIDRKQKRKIYSAKKFLLIVYKKKLHSGFCLFKTKV